MLDTWIGKDKACLLHLLSYMCLLLSTIITTQHPHTMRFPAGTLTYIGKYNIQLLSDFKTNEPHIHFLLPLSPWAGKLYFSYAPSTPFI